MKKKKKIIIISAIVFIILLAFIWIIYVFYSRSPENTDTPDDEQVSYESTAVPQNSQQAEPESTQANSISEQIQENNQDVINVELRPTIIAIYGSDARSTEASRSDIIMLLKYDPKSNTINLISIPRDSRVDIPGRGMDKINHAFAYGGEELLTQTIENLLGTEIDNYFVFKFDDFEAIIDALGGVGVNSPEDITLGDSFIPEGYSLLNGADALTYVRYRYDAEGDFGRIKRQQEVIQSIFSKLNTYYENDLTDLDEKITDIYNQYVETDIDLQSLLSYSQLFNAASEITFENYMLENEGAMINGIYYGIIVEASLEEIREVLNQE